MALAKKRDLRRKDEKAAGKESLAAQERVGSERSVSISTTLKYKVRQDRIKAVKERKKAEMLAREERQRKLSAT